MPTILVVCPPSNGGSLLLSGTTVVGSVGVNVSFWDGDNFELLVWSIMNAVKTLKVSVIFLSVCRSGLRGPLAYSLLGGGVPTQSIG